MVARTKRWAGHRLAGEADPAVGKNKVDSEQVDADVECAASGAADIPSIARNYASRRLASNRNKLVNMAATNVERTTAELREKKKRQRGGGGIGSLAPGATTSSRPLADGRSSSVPAGTMAAGTMPQLSLNARGEGKGSLYSHSNLEASGPFISSQGATECLLNSEGSEMRHLKCREDSGGRGEIGENLRHNTEVEAALGDSETGTKLRCARSPRYVGSEPRGGDLAQDVNTVQLVTEESNSTPRQWVGPSGAYLQLMSDKAISRKTMEGS